MRTQIVINNTQVDLLKEVNLNITKQLVDIQNPEKRKTDRSLTIEIPGSKANDLLFSYIFEVNIDLDADDSTQQTPHFNPNKKADVIIFIDSLPQLKGYCQLKDIVINNENKITYKIVCYGVIGDLFSKIGNAKLDELDFSEFNHVYSRGNIANSWDTEIIEGGIGVPFEPGKGYVYTMIDYGYPKRYADRRGTQELWSVEDFRPAIYVKQYIDKIFESAEYTYTSNFINTDFFKRLIIPFNSDKFILNNTEITSRQFYSGVDSSDINTTFTYGGVYSPVIFDDDSTLPFFDGDTNYNTSTGKFVCSQPGSYEFEASVDAKLKYTGTPNVADDEVLVQVALYHKSGSTVTPLDSSTATVTFTNPITTNDTSSDFVIPLKGKVKLAANDEVFVAPVEALTLNINSGVGDWDLVTKKSANSYFANGIINTVINENDTVSVTSCTPSEIKQRDFLGSIIKAFNLHIEPNPDDEKDLIIEPRADYYTGQYTDWTDKLDLSKDFTISPMAALDAGEYHFKYSDDEDFFNKEYKNRYDRTYGDYKLKIDNDFIKKTNKIELIFAPTLLYKDPDNKYSRILPNIKFFDKNGTTSPKSSKIRLLYFGGMKSCPRWYFAASGFAAFPFDNYPYSGHLDDPYDSDFDLNFAPPFEIFYRSTSNLPIQYTNQNLYTKYWYAQIKELTDKNSKLVEGWFYLTPSDIEGLSFRKYYFIKDAYYRLLKVENYDPVFSKVTKCQFLKVQEFDAPLQIKASIHGGRGTFGTTETKYDVPTTVGNFAPIGAPVSGPIVVTGWDNEVDTTNASVFLTGINNNVLSGSSVITVIGGGGNTINPSLENVTLINSSGITATESNTLYINNQKYATVIMGDSKGIANSDSPYTLTNETRTLFCDTTEGSISVNLPTAVNNNGKIFEVIKTDAAVNGITVNADGSETINGAASAGLTKQYEVLKIVSNGSSWYKL